MARAEEVPSRALVEAETNSAPFLSISSKASQISRISCPTIIPVRLAHEGVERAKQGFMQELEAALSLPEKGERLAEYIYKYT